MGHVEHIFGRTRHWPVSPETAPANGSPVCLAQSKPAVTGKPCRPSSSAAAIASATFLQLVATQQRSFDHDLLPHHLQRITRHRRFVAAVAARYSLLAGLTGGTYGTAFTARAPNSRIVFPMTSLACGCCGRVTTTPPGRMIPAFSASNLSHGIAQKFLMIERNIGNDADPRLHYVRRIQPPAHTDFEHRNLHLPPREKYSNAIAVSISKKLGCHGSSPSPTRRSAVRSTRSCTRAKSSSLIPTPFQPNALVDPHQMWRSIKPGPQPRCSQNRSKRRRSRSFAVRTGDQHAGKCRSGLSSAANNTRMCAKSNLCDGVWANSWPSAYMRAIAVS